MNKTKGILCMILSAMAFSMMQVFIALSAERIPVFEQMFFRNLMTTGIAYAALKKVNASLWGKKENRKMLLMRSIFGFLGMACLFYATAVGNQGEVAILSKLSPFVVIFCAAVFLREKPKAFQILALIVAMSGAVITADASFSDSPVPAMVAILHSIFAGLAYFCVGALKGKENPKVIVFVFSAFTTLATGLLSLTNLVVPTFRELLLLLGIGVMASIGQLSLTYAYTVAKASEVSVFNYSGIPFSMAFGYIFLMQPIKPTTFMGSLLVIASGVISFLGEHHASQVQKHQESRA